MTRSLRKHTDSTIRSQADWIFYSLELESEVEEIDREIGRDYVPMDVFIDPRTIMKHFQASPIRARLKEIHTTAG